MNNKLVKLNDELNVKEKALFDSKSLKELQGMLSVTETLLKSNAIDVEMVKAFEITKEKIVKQITLREENV